MIVYHIFPLERGGHYPVNDTGKSGDHNQDHQDIHSCRSSKCLHMIIFDSLMSAMRTPNFLFGINLFDLLGHYKDGAFDPAETIRVDAVCALHSSSFADAFSNILRVSRTRINICIRQPCCPRPTQFV